MASGPLRLDWQAIVTKLEALGVEPNASCLICIPVAGVYLLSALAERLEWRATYRVADYDYSDWDDLYQIVEDTIGGLDPMCDDLIAEIVSQTTTNVTNNVTQVVNNAAATAEMCCYMAENPVNVPPVSEVPPPGTSEDRDELCKIAQAAHDEGINFLDTAFDMAEIFGSLTIGSIAAALALLVLSIPASLVLGVIVAILALVLADAPEDTAALWNSIKHDVVCAIINAPTATAAKEAVNSVIDDAVAEAEAPAAVATLFKLIYHQGTINDIWNMNPDYDTSGYSSDYCDDCGSPIVGGYSYIVTEWLGPEVLEFHVGGVAAPSPPTPFVNGGGHWGSPAIIPCKVVNTAVGVTGPAGDLVYNNATAVVTGSPKLNVGIKNHDIGIDTLDSATIEQFKLIVSYNGGASYLEQSFPTSSADDGGCMTFNDSTGRLTVDLCTESGLTSHTITIDFDMA
jgi:hypothetical protein